MPNIIHPEEFGDKRSRRKTIPTDMPTSYGLVVVKEGKILLVKPRGTDFWEIPKGGLVGKESPHNAARRETEEETGITATITKPLDFVVDNGEDKAVVAFLADYKTGLVDKESGQVLKIQKSEIEQAKFFEPEAALATITGYLKPLIKKAIDTMSEAAIDQLIDGVLSIGSTPTVGSSKYIRKTWTSKKRPFSTHSDCKFYSDQIPTNVKVNPRDIEGWCTRFKTKVITFDKATRNGQPCPEFRPRSKP